MLYYIKKLLQCKNNLKKFIIVVQVAQFKILLFKQNTKLFY